MKSLFLLTVLFVMLAFAFKGPDQSAWDFAREVGSNVTHKINDKDGSPPMSGNVAQKLERNFENNFEQLKMRLSSAEKDIKRIGTTRTNRSEQKSEPTAPAPKPKPIVKTQQASVAPGRAQPKMSPVRKEIMPRPTLSRGPDMPARPVPAVSSSPLPSSTAVNEVSPRPAATIIDSEEMVKMGARFDRASRLLSEIK